MYSSIDHDETEIVEIKYLYELRHACNLSGRHYIANTLNMSFDRINTLCNSIIHGSKNLQPFFDVSDNKFPKLVQEYEREEIDRQNSIEKANHKNEQLIFDLKLKRQQFANIGTNKAKRRLNKLALLNPIAKAIRLALEIEDKNISAKDCYGIYQEKIYNQKTKLILQLCDLFKEQNWIYGVQESDIPYVSHIIYFEIPSCEQISWHITLDKTNENFPKYMKEWDKKRNSTLTKLETATIQLLENK